MHLPPSLLLFFTTSLCLALNAPPAQDAQRTDPGPSVLHFPIERRGGGFVSTKGSASLNPNSNEEEGYDDDDDHHHHSQDEDDDHDYDVADMALLEDELRKVAARFDRTSREMRGNKVVRKAKSPDGAGAELMGRAGEDGNWFVIYFFFVWGRGGG